MALAPLQLAPLALAAVLYALRARTLAPTSRAVPAWRQWCFQGSLLLVFATVAGPLGGLAEDRFVAHMAEHLLLADVASLGLALGLTGPVLQPVLRRRALRWLRHLAHPLPALGLWSLNLYLWHVPALHEAAVRQEVVHAAQHAGFLLFGLNVWLALFGPLPKPAWFGNLGALGLIIAVRLVGAVLANVLVFGGDAFYDVYTAPDLDADQQAAGAVMMVEESVLTLLLFGWLFLKAAREGEERQALLDLAAARGVPLDERRAARAVAAGRGGDLRERLKTPEEG